MLNNQLEGRIVQIRPSQSKFKSPDMNLEVIRCATFSQGYLNRQAILLMSSQGVKDSTFMKKL